MSLMTSDSVRPVEQAKPKSNNVSPIRGPLATRFMVAPLEQDVVTLHKFRHPSA